MQALEEIGYASYIYDAMPEQVDSTLRTLDVMMATWNAAGIHLGYTLPSDAEGSNSNDDAGIPDSAYEAVYMNLAVRIGPRFGKKVSDETKMFAKLSYDAMLTKAVQPTQQQMPSNVPAGAGNKPWRRQQQPFLRPPKDNLKTGLDNQIILK